MIIEPEKKDIEKWVEALRSGKYKQSIGWLENQMGHCCLGVACRVFIKPADLTKKDYSDELRGRTVDLQTLAPSWLRAVNNDFCDKTGKTLVRLNDDINFRLSFDEIADCLEAVYIHEVLS